MAHLHTCPECGAVQDCDRVGCANRIYRLCAAGCGDHDADPETTTKIEPARQVEMGRHAHGKTR